jgi:diacylglycerol kinase (ATP)
LRYVAAALRAFSEFVPLTVRAEFPDGGSPPIEDKVLLAAVLNTPTYGGGIRLAAMAKIDDGLLNAILVKDLSALQVLALVPRLMTTGDLPESHLRRVRAKRVRLAANRPCLFHGDGEILGPAPVEIEVLPRAIRILAPVPH